MRAFALSLALACLVFPSIAISGVANPESEDATEPSARNHGPRGADVPYVIVTTRALRPAFLRLARAHTHDGLRAGVWTLEAIRDAYPAGRDDAERLRMFLQNAYAEHGARWLLIGAGDALIPMRRVVIGPPFPGELPTDQYYACLDGSWNADGDDQWGELETDDVDLAPELNVGRAPVTTRREADAFVARTLDALDERRCAPPTRSVLMIASQSVGVIDFAPIIEPLRPLFEADPGTHVARLYRTYDQWPGSLPLTHAACIDSLNRGYDVVVMAGPGGPGIFALSDGSTPADRDYLYSSELYDLSNRRKSLVIVESAFTCAPGSVPSIGEALINARRGGAVGVLGATQIQFISGGAIYVRSLLESGAPTIGEAMRVAIDHLNVFGGSQRLTTQGMTLFGDPALPLSMPGLPNVVAGTPAVMTASLATDLTTELGAVARGGMRAGVPAPGGAAPLHSAPAAPDLSWTSKVAAGDPRLVLSIPASLAGSPLEVAVFDPAGRRVRTLEHSVATAGSRPIAWDTTDDRGAHVRPGVYFIGARAGGRAATNRVIVVH